MWDVWDVEEGAADDGDDLLIDTVIDAAATAAADGGSGILIMIDCQGLLRFQLSPSFSPSLITSHSLSTCCAAVL